MIIMRSMSIILPSSQFHLTMPSSKLTQPQSITATKKENHSESKTNFKPSTKIIFRLVVALLGLGILYVGKFSVPSEEVACLKDKVMDLLQFANNFINKPGHEGFRDAFQALCSFMMDITFVGTFSYWVFRGKSIRLPLTVGAFYLIRAIVQKLFVMPFPEGYYWYSPPFPSLTVPYGRGSDFFFSGHSGFLIICAREWGKVQCKYHKAIRNIVLAFAAYTVVVLLVYRIHYFIDIFTGVFFADYMWVKMNYLRKFIDPVIVKVSNKIYSLIWGKQEKKEAEEVVVKEEKIKELHEIYNN